MKKITKLVLIPIMGVMFIFLSGREVRASHLLGADLSWTCVGKDSFLVTVVIYRDCNGIPLGTPHIPIRCIGTGQTINTLSITKPAPIDITPLCESSCTRCQSTSCSFPYGIEKYVCTKLAVLSGAGSCCKVSLVYQECCRNGTITTGAANANFYVDAEMDRCVSPCYNSPRFTNPPLAIICESQDFVFNNGVVDDNVDSNGGLMDSIAYEWTQPMTGSGSYTTWTGQYAYDHPVFYWGFKNANLPFPRGFHLNKSNGDISFRPMKVEQTVMSIKVSQWRKINGQMTNIGFIKRDLQIAVISCSSNRPPFLSGQNYKEVYAGDTVSFEFSTNDGDTDNILNISWNNAIASANWSDNNGSVSHPTGYLSWCPGKEKISTIPYLFTVTVKDNNCPVSGNAIKGFQILVSPKASGKLRFQQTSCDTFLLEAYDLENVRSINWYVNQKRLSSINPFPFHINKADKYVITLELLGKGSPIYLYDTIDLTGFIDANLPADTVLCKGDSIGIHSNVLHAQGTVKYKWSTGDTASFIQLPPLYNDTVIYLEVQDSVFCHTDSMLIKVDQFNLSVTQDQITCPGVPSLLKASPLFDEGQAVTSFYWFDISCSCPKGYDSTLSVYQSGTFVCSVVNNFGCTAADTVKALFYSKPDIIFSSIADKCLNEADFSLVPYSYPKGGYWNSQEQGLVSNDTFLISKATVNEYMLLYSYTDTLTGCSNTDKTTVKVKDFPKINVLKEISYCDEDRLIDLFNHVAPAGGVWNTSHPGVVNTHFFNPHQAASSSLKLSYRIDSTNGCSNTLLLDYNINPAPKVDFTVDSLQGYPPLMVNFSNLSSISSGSLAYLWYFGDGDSSFLENPAHTYQTHGKYDVRLIAISDSFCLAENNKAAFVEVFNAIADDPADKTIRIYPNPVQNKVYIESSRELEEVVMYNSLGEKVMEIKAGHNNKLIIDCSFLPSGLYLMNVIVRDGSAKVFKLISE